MDAWLPLIFMGLMALAMLVYVVLDGYDLGVGMLVPFADNPGKDRMVASIGPFWDANETWLVLGVGLLLVAFPVAHGVILGALYLPVLVMLLGLILRGVAFDFRAKAHDEHRVLWNAAFSVGSLAAALAQGYMVGRYVVGFEPGLVPVVFAAFIGLCLAAGYTLLGATWLLLKMEGPLVRQAAGWGWWALWLTGTTVNVVAYIGLIMLAGIVVNQSIVLIDAVNQARERGLRLLLQRAVEGDQAAAKGGELAATAVAPAGGAQHQRLGRHVVHVVHRVPGGLVGHGNGLGGLQDGAVLGDGFEQADALVAEEAAHGGVDHQLAHQGLAG